MKQITVAFFASVLALGMIWGTPHAHAQDVKVIRQNSASYIDVSVNRAVVVESDIPFAELSIANPEIADISSLSDRSIYLLGRATGLTTLTLLDATGRLITNIDVRVTADISEFKQRLRQILPNENIEVRAANDGIVMSGTVSGQEAILKAQSLASLYVEEGRISNLLKVGGVQQVMLKVRFAEVSRSVSKAIESAFAAKPGSSATGNSVLNVGTGSAISQSTANSILGGNLSSGSDNAGGFNFSFGNGSVEVGILLEALETKGLVRTLAEPNLTALSGKDAKFHAGSEYPVPVSSGEGEITIDYKPIGILMEFKPTVIEGDLIRIEMKTEVSAIDTTAAVTTNGLVTNAFSTRNTSTTVEMRDGESFAIAGLLQDDFRDQNSQVPILGDIPVLGALFRSADYARSQSELVVIITPSLVTPTTGDMLALPTDNVLLPTESDLFLMGRTEGRRNAVDEVADQGFTGSYGYTID